jgi:hypothetical protein
MAHPRPEVIPPLLRLFSPRFDGDNAPPVGRSGQQSDDCTIIIRTVVRNFKFCRQHSFESGEIVDNTTEQGAQPCRVAPGSCARTNYIASPLHNARSSKNSCKGAFCRRQITCAVHHPSDLWFQLIFFGCQHTLVHAPSHTSPTSALIARNLSPINCDALCCDVSHVVTARWRGREGWMDGWREGREGMGSLIEQSTWRRVGEVDMSV